ncbi:MAG: BrnA antitoxin family protein [Spirochaetaceae bacterium]|nr:BrnA antitoxin family protein [Spirochaetaceae bacterium]
MKQSITLRIGADVLAVLKGYGKGYQAKGNNSLNKAKILFFPHLLMEFVSIMGYNLS